MSKDYWKPIKTKGALFTSQYHTWMLSLSQDQNRIISELLTRVESVFQLKGEFRSFLNSLLDTIESLFVNKKWLHICEPHTRPRWMATFEVESVPGSRFLPKVEAEALLRKLGELRQENPSQHYKVIDKLG